MDETDPLLSLTEMARLAGISRNTITQYRTNGRLPPPDVVDGPRRPRWLKSTFDGWMAGRQAVVRGRGGNDDRFLNLTEMAKMIGFPQHRIYDLRRAGRFPPPDDVTVPRKPLWRKSTYDKWAATQGGDLELTSKVVFSFDEHQDEC